MTATIKPVRFDWPSAFWRRAESSYADCDLLCRSCSGSGAALERKDVARLTTIDEVVCGTCRGSGLLVPARHRPDDVAAVMAAADEGAWLDWLGHDGDQLVWPQPWAWTVVNIRREVYHADDVVLAFTANRRVVAGLFRITGDAVERLREVFRRACGPKAAVPRFVLPAAADGSPHE